MLQIMAQSYGNGVLIVLMNLLNIFNGFYYFWVYGAMGSCISVFLSQKLIELSNLIPFL